MATVATVTEKDFFIIPNPSKVAEILVKRNGEVYVVHAVNHGSPVYSTQDIGLSPDQPVQLIDGFFCD